MADTLLGRNYAISDESMWTNRCNFISRNSIILLQQEKGESSEEKFESHKYKMQDKITMYTSLVVVAAVFRFGISTIMPSLFWFLGSKRARFDLTKPGGLGSQADLSEFLHGPESSTTCVLHRLYYNTKLERGT